MKIIEDIFGVITSFTCLMAVFSVVYCWGFERRKYFWLRLVLIPIYALFTTYNYVTFNLRITEAISWLYGIIPYINTFYILNAVLCVFILRFLFRENYLNLIFIVIIAYISEHMCSHVKQLSAWFIQGHETTLPLSSMITEVIFAILLAVVIKLLLKKYLDRGLIPRRKIQIIFMVVAIVALMGVSSYVYSHVLFSIVTNMYEILIAVLLFFLLFSIFGYSGKEHNEIVVKQLLDEQIKQTNSFNENYEFINMKFHDLKKQVRGLEEVMGETPEIHNIKTSIAVHETNLDTGNPSLNIVIREYAITCRRKNIQYYCMADGSALSFLCEEDIYGIFHNALSNAVEAAEKCDPGERYVSVTVRKHDEMVRITVENSFCGQVKFADGLPATTKQDKVGHGFGVKSIKYILKKYGGNMTISAEDGVYRLRILFMN